MSIGRTHRGKHSICYQFCKGEGVEVTCDQSGADHKKCIQSCLDCKAPHPNPCHCPSIFPSISGGATSRDKSGSGLAGDAVEDEDGVQLVSSHPKEASLDVLIVAVIVIGIVVACCCVAFFLLRRRKYQTTSPANTDPNKLPPPSGYHQQPIGYPMRQRPPSHQRRPRNDSSESGDTIVSTSVGSIA